MITFRFQLENCGRPAIITKDLSMIIYGRDARTGPRSLKHLFTGNYRNAEANRLSGVYELLLRRASEAGSPGLSLLRIENLPFLLAGGKLALVAIKSDGNSRSAEEAA